MTIERLSFPDGVRFESDPKEQVLRLILWHVGEIVRLSEGDYNLTPAWWTEHLHNHHLTVLADGTGLYRLLPKESGVGTRDSRTGIFQKGGKLIRIPQDQTIAITSGPLKDRQNLGIYEIVFHIPGLSPENSQ